MLHRFALLSLCLLIGSPFCLAADAPSLRVARGEIEKATKDSITLKPRSPSGKFEKSLVLHLTGTSKLTTQGQQVRSGKSVFIQKDANLKDLKEKKVIAAIYAAAKEGNVLLTAVESVDATPLLVVAGTVEKAGKDSLTIRPHGSGKTDKPLVLHVSGTSRIAILGRQMRSGKTVWTQKDAAVTDLKEKQPIAVVYATGKSAPVLLAAVVQPESGK